MLPRSGLKPTISENTLESGAVVTYEHDGSTLIAIILAFKKPRYLVFNERGREVELVPDRLWKVGGNLAVDPGATTAVREKALQNLRAQAEANADEIPLNELWDFFSENQTEIEVKELADQYFGASVTQVQQLGMRLALVRDRIYFKREKNGFSPRPGHIVESQKRAEEVRLAKEKERADFLTFLKNSKLGERVVIPQNLRSQILLLEQIAAQTADLEAPRQKEGKELVELAAPVINVQVGNLEQRAFEILLRIGHFEPDENLSFIRYGIRRDFSSAVVSKAKQLASVLQNGEVSDPYASKRRDLTSLQTITIDDASTKDMDDALSIDQISGGYVIGVHITDVAYLLRGEESDNPVEQEARRRGTSIYCPDLTVNMVPEELSTNALSLLKGEKRRVLSCLFTVDHNLQITSSEITPATIEVKERLSYEEVDDRLEKGGTQLDLLYQWGVTQETERIKNGALKIAKRDVLIAIDENKIPQLRMIDEHGPARGLVGEAMVQANRLMATYGASKRLPLAFRSQQGGSADDDEPSPELPQGPAQENAMRMRLKKSLIGSRPSPHASLGLQAYIQATSPIRRYLDICNQRQILEHLTSGRMFWNEQEFNLAIEAVEQTLSMATQVSRESKRYWLLKYLLLRCQGKLPESPKNDLITATVVRVDLKSPLVELDEVFFLSPVRSAKPLQPGEKVTLRIANVDPHGDYLKLEVIGRASSTGQ